MYPVTILISIFYLLRSFFHISSRSKWYIATLLLLFFLTSTYETTYLGFIFSTNLFNLKFNWLNNLSQNWFSGGELPLFLSGLLFIVIKSTLYKISRPLYIELLVLSFASIITLMKNLPLLSSFPISISLILAMVIHYFKNQDSLNIKSFGFFILRNKFGLDTKKSICLVISFLYIIISIFSSSNLLNLSLLSQAHINRIILILFFLFLTSLFKMNSSKFLYGLIPLSLIYIGLITSSLLTNFFIGVNNQSVMTLECMTSIALYPIVEVLQNRYYLINSYSNRNINFKVRRNLYRYFVNFFMTLVTLTYILYLFTQ